MHVGQLKGDLHAASKTVKAAAALVETFDFNEKRNIRNADIDYLGFLKALLIDAAGILDCADQEADEIEFAIGPVAASDREAANG
jgi:hypothetical protein